MFSLKTLINLQRHLELFGSWVPLELKPVAAGAPFGLALEHPEPFHVGVVGIADAAHAPEAVHGVHNVGALFGSLSTNLSFHEEGILERRKRGRVTFEKVVVPLYKNKIAF